MKNDILEFVKTIVVNELPEDQEIFELYGEDCYNLLNEGDTLDSLRKQKGGHYEFSVDTVEKIARSISVLAGTIKIFFDMRKGLKYDKNKVEFLREKWEAELMLNGLSKEKATTISEKYISDMQKMLS